MTRCLFAITLLFACAHDDDDAEPGSELGPCVQAQLCEQPLVCTDGICVHPDQLAEDDGGTDDGVVRHDLGGICCDDGSSCACWTTLASCLEGATPVESCSVESLGCGEGSTKLAACN